MKIDNILICAFFAITAMMGCVREFDPSEMQQEHLGEDGGFTLVATYGPADTKVAFEEDELGLMWEQGDKLFLVDVAGKNETVELTTSIVEASKSASFQSSKSVLSGSYFVMSSDTVASITPRNVLSSKEDLKKYLKLYGTLTIEDGQKTATITLNLAYPKLKFNLKNFPAGLRSTAFGMAISKNGIPYKGTLTTDGFVTDTTAYKQILSMGGNSIVDGMSAFMPPYDYTGSTILFYYYGTDSDGSHVTYEIQKQGINLLAGMSYNVELDFAQATQSKIVGNVLNTAAEFRAAAYWSNSGNSYSVGSDIDFSGEICVPILCKSLEGNGHTLKNISIDLQSTDYVGLLSKGCANNLTLENVDIKGKDDVGAISGYAVNDMSNIAVKGSSEVTGNIGVGGLVGCIFSDGNMNHSTTLLSCSYEGDVEGKYSVGGLVGCTPNITYTSQHNYRFKTCYAKGHVRGKGHVGGLVGSFFSYARYYMDDSKVLSCSYDGDVEGEDYVGGLIGSTFSKYGGSESFYFYCIEKCYAKGNVSGRQYVGGLVGDFNSSEEYVRGENHNGSKLFLCWYKGSVKGMDYVGGLCGYFVFGPVKNSYIIGNVTVDESGKYVGGIVGYGSNIYNCYSYGTVTDDIGISYDLSSPSTNLTSCLKLSASVSSSDFVSCGPEKTFLSKLSVINGDEAYSTQVWEGIDAGCPLLQWQSDVLSGEITIPGYGDQDW